MFSVENTTNNEQPQEVKIESSSNKNEDLKTIKVVQQPNKKKTLFDRLYKQASDTKKRVITATFLSLYLLVAFVLALLSDSTQIILKQGQSFQFVPLIIFLFFFGITIWTTWYASKEIDGSYSIVKNNTSQHTFFALMITAISVTTLSYFWASYFWNANGIKMATLKGAIIAFITIGIISLCLVFALSTYCFYRNGQAINKSLIGAALVTIVTLFYILLYYSVCARNWVIILSIVVISFATDIGGYFGGKKFGSHKMAPEISPKKTWEGFGIGLLFGLVAGIIIMILISIPVWGKTIKDTICQENYILQSQICGWQAKNHTAIDIGNKWWAAATLLPLGLSAISVAGDLLFSKFKRIVGVKDFGNMLPGHGGILDRFDSVILVTIVFVGLSIFICLVTYGVSTNSPLLSNIQLGSFPL